MKNSTDIAKELMPHSACDIPELAVIIERYRVEIELELLREVESLYRHADCHDDVFDGLSEMRYEIEQRLLKLISTSVTTSK